MEVVDFEYTILKSLVHDGLYFNKCFDILRVNYFKNVGNKELFKLLKNYYWTNIILQDITDSSSSKTYDLSTEQIFIDTTSSIFV